MNLSKLKYFVLIALIYLPIFGHLDGLTIRLWDESRQAINAVEMLDNGNYIVTHFGGEPDMWNTKPPLMIWCQVICFKLFGINEIAVRLPSAIAAFLTCALLLVFSMRYLHSFLLGSIAVMILITSQGYIELHGTRTGDYDALLTLFTTASCFLFFTYCHTKNIRFLYLFFASITFAVLTKSIAGILFAPALVIYAIIEKQFIPLLKNKHFYIGAGSFLITIGGYYLLREYMNPGYLQAVQENELGGRYLNTIENHKWDNYFYYTNLIERKYTAWYLFALFGAIIGLFYKNERIKKVAIFSILMVLFFFTIISTAQTKLHWYDVPLYPFLAILGAICIYSIFDFLKNSTWANQVLTFNILPFLFLFFIFKTPYQKIIEKTYLPTDTGVEVEVYELSRYIKKSISGQHNLNNQYILYKGYCPHADFYVRILNKKEVSLSFKYWIHDLTDNTVIVIQQELKDYINKHYHAKIIGVSGNVTTYKIYDKK